MAVYTVEGKTGYPGKKEYDVPTGLVGGIYAESLVPRTPLPYRMRKIKIPELDKGYVVDGKLLLLEGSVQFTPQGLDVEAIKALYLRAVQRNPQNPNFNEADYATLSIPHSYMRANRGLKLLLPFEDGEWVARLIPPPAKGIASRRSVWD